MTKKTTFIFVVLLFVTSSVLSHDMFLKFSGYFLKPNSEATVALINGTFDKSENAISRDRMLDVSIVGPDNEVTHPDEAGWLDLDNTAWLQFQTGAPGTYVLGVSTAPKTIELSADDFNEYLEHDGVLDVLADRKKSGILDKPALELYSKHVKAIYQVGDQKTGSFNTDLTYPIEIIPKQNPYLLQAGDDLEVLILREGKPVPNQLVYASYEGHHQHNDDGEHDEAVATKTNEEGIATINLNVSGIWYVRLIHMVQHPDPEIDYESNWATLTFEIK